jgi:hypothetical protein
MIAQLKTLKTKRSGLVMLMNPKTVEHLEATIEEAIAQVVGMMLVSVAPAGLDQMFFEVGVPLAEGAPTALPPTKEEIEKLLSVAPRYGIEIKLPGRCWSMSLDCECFQLVS